MTQNTPSFEGPDADTPGLPDMEQHVAWPLLSRLPVLLSVSVPIRWFRVRDLLDLKQGQTILSLWPASDDVPLRARQQRIARGEFEVIENRVALRLTRLG